MAPLGVITARIRNYRKPFIFIIRDIEIYKIIYIYISISRNTGAFLYLVIHED